MRTSQRVGVCSVLVAFLVIGFGVVQGAAQSTTDGAIGGTVYDPSGATVPNAKVVLRNNGTNIEQMVTTDESGYYRAARLQPGSYTVSINVTGFASFKAGQVIVQVGSVTELHAHLNVASAGDIVLVTTAIPQINTTSADFATSVDEKSISELPINGRRWSTFALLTPGVVPDGSFGLLSFRGISGLLNNNTVDGGDNNQAFFSEEKGRTRISYSVGQASIKEF